MALTNVSQEEFKILSEFIDRENIIEIKESETLYHFYFEKRDSRNKYNILTSFTYDKKYIKDLLKQNEGKQND